MRPDRHGGDPSAVVERLLLTVSWRQWVRHFAFTIAIAAPLAALSVLATQFAGGEAKAAVARQLAVVVGVTAAIGWAARSHSRADAARAIERARPACRNLVVTAEELQRHPDRASAPVRGRVALDAAAAIGGLRPSQVVPLRLAYLAMLLALAVAVLATPRGQTRAREALSAAARTLPAGRSVSPVVRVTVEPPPYTGRSAVVLTDPVSLEALEGSRIRFELPPRWRVRFGDDENGDTQLNAKSLKGAPTMELIARRSGYFAVENSGEGTRRLLPLSVTADHAPSIRIETPARDLLLANANRTIPVAIRASDDLGLKELELRITKVSGAGERFEFAESRVPVAIQRASDREWTARGTLVLPAMQLGPGDSVVYSAIARDHRSGDAGLAASDTYFVEIAGPGQIPLEGIDMPPHLDRYALSQQMIVMKLERLRARESAMPRDELTEESAGLAAEQRTVRASFVFLLGGHVEDEEVEAEQSHEIQEGRLENTARKEIAAAISAMTRAEQGLTAANTAAALPHARAAVEALQRAFGRSRYLLRALAVRARLDPSRRLAGDLAGAGGWHRTPPDPEAREGEAARQLLARLFVAADQERGGAVFETPVAQQLAEAALAIDPSSGIWREISRRLLEARDTRALQSVIPMVASEALRGTLVSTPVAAADSPLRRAHDSERRR